MILQLTSHHSKKIAGFFLVLFYSSIVLPMRAENGSGYKKVSSGFNKHNLKRYSLSNTSNVVNSPMFNPNINNKKIPNEFANRAIDKTKNKSEQNDFIGGPGQPEMSSFKSVGANNLVNLFTGDFSYNIPLLDVGGYPVNIYYDGGISPEQEASWVGLGWNLNPGNINRDMRGVPDDFNGQDTLRQVQIMKPNKTWGFAVGGDAELLGVKPLSIKAGGSVGVAFNNYLGPSLDLALRGNASYKIGSIAGSEKFTLSTSANIGIDINSRNGTSFSGGVSLNANAQLKNNSLSFGTGLSTGYNSRSGIKALQLYEQASFSQYEAGEGHYKNGESYSYNKAGYKSATLYSTSISFVKPSYIPSLRMPITNIAWSGHFQLGLGSYGVEADVEAEVYGQKSFVDKADSVQLKPMVGYLYYQNAVNNPNYVMDFTRFNDKEVTPNTPVISVPQYSYDIFSIQGEGTGGSIRAYRNDLGYVRDNITTSKDKNLSVGADIAPPGHYGANFNTVKTPSSIGEWNKGNKLRNSIQFTKSTGTFENVYFRNPGESSVIDSTRYKQIGGTDLVRFVLDGTGQSPTVEPKLQTFDNAGKPQPALVDLSQSPVNAERNKRTQVINFLTAEEASVAGLDKVIKSYDNTTFLDAVTDTLIYTSIPRIDGQIRKAHHISQIDVTESNGRRYIYGLPVYNIKQKDFTFSVDFAYSVSSIPDKIPLNSTQIAQASINSPLLNDNSKSDGYVQITTTPAYAHSFLLSGILSPDYVDVTGDGITEDDLGDAVKFNYKRTNPASFKKWRTPLGTPAANFNAGNWSEVKDDKAIISYGEREAWYLQSIESKTMIALFYLSSRIDACGPTSEFGAMSFGDGARKLDSIALFSKADLKKNGHAKAKPLKTVHFVYSSNSISLCRNTPDGFSSGTGKLTLKNIYFTYNGKTRAVKNKYNFTYAYNTGTENAGSSDNPNYVFASTDRWGTYKSVSLNGLKKSDYPYSLQDKATIDVNAAAWMLKKISLPSGGQIEMTYESDDYAYVQNKRAAVMTPVVGFGNTTSFSAATDRLYPFTYPSPIENDYVFMQVPDACSNATDVYNKYLQGTSQLAFKIWVQMPKGPEYITCYANFGNVSNVDYGVDASNANIIWVKMKRLGGKSPLSITALEYLRQQLPGQAFKGYDVSGEPALKQVGDMLLGMLQGLRDAFTDPVNAFRKDGKAQHTDLSKCFVRLNDPDGFKYGGGYRVKSVVLKDNWNAMTGQFTSSYGQKYDYTTTENFNGAVRAISSGVASYEPSIGGEENPWQTIMQVEDQLPLGPASYGAVEMPVLDAFFPSPVVGYSKVTVTSVKTNTDTTKKSRSGIGKQVTEFYTAKDFPVYYSYTPFDANSVKEFHQASTQNFFNKYAYDFKAQSQGFLIATNDMHGKMKSQSSYAENDTSTRINYTENFYRNTGVNGLNDKFTFVSKENNGNVYPGNMGVDIELMTDTREFSVKSSSLEVQGQVDLFYFPLGAFPIPTVWSPTGEADNIYRSVTTTKVINYHAVLDSVVVIDKGSQVSTRNLAYDAHTGDVLVSRTNNEFNKPIYSTSYPAYWAYSGMGLAYKNIDASYSDVNFSDGKIVSGMSSSDINTLFESGDELYIINTGSAISCPSPSSSNTRLIWAFDKNKNATSLINTSPDFIFLDEAGKPYNRSGVKFRIIRSGRRNMLDAQTASVTSIANPLTTGKLLFDTASKVINAAAIEFKEKWQTDNDAIKRMKLVFNSATCTFEEVEDSTGYLEKAINPYRKGLLGNFRTDRSMIFYGSRKEYDTTANTNIVDNGFLKNFKLYWDFNSYSNLIPDTLSSQWVWNSRLNKVNAKGLELETLDALGIYISAQYGYNKTMPVAIVNNGRYNEMFAEGFEDYEYGESLSNAKFNYGNKHIDFAKMTNSTIVNTDNFDFKSHSGKFVLGVNPGVTAAKTFDLINPVTDSYNLNFTTDAVKSLVNPGGNFTVITAPTGTNVINPTFSNLGMNGWQGMTVPYSTWNSVLYQTDQYFEVATSSTFTVQAHYQAQSDFATIYGTAYQWKIVNVETNLEMPVTNISINNFSNSGIFISDSYDNICLPPGIYKLTCKYGGSQTNTVCPDNLGCQQGISYNYQVSLSTSFVSYKDVSTQTSCIYTKPLPAKDSILNPVFSILSGKKMLFSAWVRENCGDPANGIPCKEYTYTHNQVQLNFPGYSASDVILNPSGPIIDGWQRYEGTFTSPTGATTMTLNFVNSGTGTIYFDDIRIHPFNANMKSYVYDPVSLRLVAELDANNYATFYEYDEEGTLIRTKVETREGIKTVTETRSAIQKVIQ
jgi:hypothetical protein